jgi:hypothetical protein
MAASGDLLPDLSDRREGQMLIDPAFRHNMAALVSMALCRHWFQTRSLWSKRFGARTMQAQICRTAQKDLLYVADPLLRAYVYCEYN